MLSQGRQRAAVGGLDEHAVALDGRRLGMETAWAAERAFLKRLEGGCQVPIAAHGKINQGRLELEGLVASVDGIRLIRNRVSGPPEEAEVLGIRLADRLLSAGAGEILKEIYRAGLDEPAPP